MILLYFARNIRDNLDSIIIEVLFVASYFFEDFDHLVVLSGGVRQVLEENVVSCVGRPLVLSGQGIEGRVHLYYGSSVVNLFHCS